jgi:MFS family permease
MKNIKNYNLTKTACYLTGASTAIPSVLSPILFVTFRNMYGLSYTQLGALVVINFFTQLLVDLVFTFATKYFNVEKSARSTPLVIFIGLMVYGIMPLILPGYVYLWIVVSTIIFSVGSGLAEVLVSPVVAAMPSDNHEREMSKLHSMYACGVVCVVILSTLYIKLFGAENWMYMSLIWSIVPLTSFVLYCKSPMPELNDFGKSQKNDKLLTKGVLLCTFCIFLGGAAECTMAQWASGFIENAIGIPKVYGDILGVAFFAVLLGTGRTLYSKFGKNIINFLLFGMIGATICYFVAGFVLNPVIGVIACALTGLCTSMLWPGTLIYVDEKFANVSVAVYALMASGGDMGASIAPQLVGIMSDKVSMTEFAYNMSVMFNITAEQVGMRSGLVVAGLFPLAGVVLILYMKKYFGKRDKITL